MLEVRGKAEAPPLRVSRLRRHARRRAAGWRAFAVSLPMPCLQHLLDVGRNGWHVALVARPWLAPGTITPGAISTPVTPVPPSRAEDQDQDEDEEEQRKEPEQAPPRVVVARIHTGRARVADGDCCAGVIGDGGDGANDQEHQQRPENRETEPSIHVKPPWVESSGSMLARACECRVNSFRNVYGDAD